MKRERMMGGRGWKRVELVVVVVVVEPKVTIVPTYRKYYYLSKKECIEKLKMNEFRKSMQRKIK